MKGILEEMLVERKVVSQTAHLELDMHILYQVEGKLLG